MKNAFASWKIYLAIFSGLLVTAYLIYSNLQATHFIKVASNQGTHCWIDGNLNYKVDANLDVDFKLCQSGAYKKEQISDLLKGLNWESSTFLWLALAVVCMFGRDVFYMLRIKILTKNQLTWNSSFYVILLWEFASALSPGVVGGASVAMFILNKEKINLGRSTSIVLITALMDNLFFILLIPIVFLFVAPSVVFPTHSSIDKSIAVVFWIGFGILFLVCFLLFTSIFIAPKSLGRLLLFVCKLPFLTKFTARVNQLDADIQTSSNVLKNEPWKFWITSFLATLGSWSCRYLVINCILAAFLPLSFSQHFFVLGKQLVLWLFMLVSPTPGGSGIAEFAFGELLGELSNSALLIIALAIIWRLISYFPYLIIGAVILPKWWSRLSKHNQLD